jgi:hypothetical protein
MNWLQKLSYQVEEVPHVPGYDDEGTSDRAERYFGVGHGDFDEETGESSTYVVWVLLGGEIETSGVMGEEDSLDEEKSEAWGFEGPGGTHGSIWGHDTANSTYKGRYEPDTGKITVVRPDTSAGHRPVPDHVWRALEERFNRISDVLVF